MLSQATTVIQDPVRRKNSPRIDHYLDHLGNIEDFEGLLRPTFQSLQSDAIIFQHPSEITVMY